MSTIYLVRHGQAGTRDNYDCLSKLGQMQATLLGEYFASQKLTFHTAICGALQRQRQTAEAVAHAAPHFPAITVDENWNEFDLTRIYREIAPQLCAEDPEFASNYAVMMDQIRSSGSSANAPVHRQWQPCDSQVVQAWMSGKYREEGETWQQFHDRIAGCLNKIRQLPDEQNVVVFTSATPIGIWGGMALDIFDRRSIRLAGVMDNSAYSVFRIRNGNLRMVTFNATAHLSDAGLRTHR